MKLHAYSASLLILYCMFYTASGAEPYYEPDFCSRIVNINQNVLVHRDRFTRRTIRSFLVFEIHFPKEDAWLFENCTIAALFPILPNYITYNDVQFFESVSYDRKPKTIITFRKTVDNKMKYLIWIRINCGPWEYYCRRETEDRQWWRPELYITNCKDWRMNRCRLWQFYLKCDVANNQYCDVYLDWFRLKINRTNGFPKVKYVEIQTLSREEIEEKKVVVAKKKPSVWCQLVTTTVFKALLAKVIIFILFIVWYKRGL